MAPAVAQLDQADRVAAETAEKAELVQVEMDLALAEAEAVAVVLSRTVVLKMEAQAVLASSSFVIRSKYKELSLWHILQN